ncbi:MAG: Na+/H+ antiporter NhaC family protein [Candidatus Chromulinivorax sp.]
MNSKLIALLPCCVFLGTFSFLHLIYRTPCTADNNFAIFAAFIALIVAIFTFHQNETFNERIEIFIHGSGQPTVVHTCYIFFLTTIFTTVLAKTGCIQPFAHFLLYIIPIQFILPCLFIIAALFAYIVSTSIGTIAIAMPVILTLSEYTHIDLSLITATLVCSAIFGENLSILTYNQTTSKNININALRKIFFNIKVIAPAFIASLLLITYKNSFITNTIHIPTINMSDIIKSIPYVATLCFALTGLDFIIIMVLIIMIALAIGLYLHQITPLIAISILFDGFYYSKNMVNIFILILLLSGLSSIIIHNGGIEYIIKKLEVIIKKSEYSKFIIFCLIALCNMFIAIIMSGQYTKSIWHTQELIPDETDYFPDIMPCVLQGMLPYMPQLLLAATMAQVSLKSLIVHLYYQIFLGISLFLIILYKTKFQKN